MSKIISFLVLLALIPSAAVAQIIPDSSLGAENSLVESNGNRDTINGGAVRNTNLFHSFQEFNVGSGRETYFTNPDGIANIFSRVTGNNLSNIQGVLGVFGNANLFLINPNGILFGENARLDVNGSFFATTADSVLFNNGLEFSAVNGNQLPLLTIDIPIGLRFRDNPGDITVKGTGNGTRLFDSEVIDTQEALRVDSNATIGLVGGTLLFEDATIKTAGGRIEIGSVEEGEVELVKVANGFTVNYSAVETFGDISLSGTSIIDASGLGGGDIQVAGKNISITGLSGFGTATLGSKPGGDINILATDSLEISGIENEDNFVSGILNQIFPDGTADGGDINIKTGRLYLGDRAGIATVVFGQGNAGNVNISASESISLVSEGNDSGIASAVANTGRGNAGNIELDSVSLTIANGAFVSSETLGKGNAGLIKIDTTENIFLDGDSKISGISSSVGEGAIGNGGEVRINTKNLSLTNGAQVLSDSFGTGNAGFVTIEATENISLDGESRDNISTVISSSVEPGAVGNGGKIQIISKNLSLTNGAQVRSSTFGKGNAGLVTIKATNHISLDGEGKDGTSSAIASSVESGAVGNGGEIRIDTKNLSLTNGAFISSSTLGQGNAGNMQITATEFVSLAGEDKDGFSSFIDSSVLLETVGNGGEIRIDTKNLSLANGTQISSNILGEGNAGNVTIIATQSVSLDGENQNNIPSQISSSVEPQGVGDGGEISLNTQNLSITNGAQIGNSTLGTGNAGILEITATESISLDGQGRGAARSAIDSSVQQEAVGNAGEIRLNTKHLSLTNGAFVSSNTLGQGNAGIINITATESISLDGQGRDGNISSITSAIDTKALGNQGEIRLNTKNLSLTNGAQIFSSTFGIGNAGIVDITATESIFLDGENSNGFNSAISSSVQPGAIGDGREIRLNTKNLSLTNGAQISSSTFGEGNAGIVDITATESVLVDGKGKDDFGSGISSFGGLPAGNGGEISINTSNLSLTNEGFVSSSNFDQGNSGNVTIIANSVLLENQGRITARASSGEQGNIIIKIADNLILKNNSQISARATNKAKGGNIDIDAQFIIAFPNQNNDIIASAEQGQGGEIYLTAEALFGIKERPLNPITNDINASSEFGSSGIVNITQPDVNPASGLIDLTQEVVDPAKLIAQNVCQQTANSKFVDIGKGGLPQNPQDVLAEDTIDVGLVAPVNVSKEEIVTHRERESVKPKPTRKPPAQGWIWHDNGIVELVAYNPHRTGDRRTWDNHSSCP